MTGVLIQNRTASMNIDSLNRSVVTASAVENGAVFLLEAQSGSSGYEEVWNYAVPASGSLNKLWMANSDEVVVTTSGNSQYKGIDPDPRNFTNIGGLVFDAFKPQAGDIITLTADGVSGSPSTGLYVNSASATTALAFGAAHIVDSLSLYMIKETYISIGTGAIDNQRVLAYKFEVLSN